MSGMPEELARRILAPGSIYGFAAYREARELAEAVLRETTAERTSAPDGAT